MAKEELLVVLEDIGLSKNQAKIYLKLIELGPSSVGELAAQSNVHRTNIYDALDKLIERGLVSYIFRGSVKLFQASSPSVLSAFLQERQERLNNVIPQLLVRNKTARASQNATVYEGLQGIRAMNNDMIQEGKEILAFGIPRQTAEILKSALPMFHRRRIEKKIPMKHVYDEDANERIAYLNSLPFTEARYLPTKIGSPATTLVYGNKVAFVIWSEPLMGILIQSKKMAEQYRRYFALLYRLSSRKK